MSGTPISWEELPPDIRAELNSETPDMSLVRDYVVKLLKSETGISLVRGTVAETDFRDFLCWWHARVDGSPVTFRKFPRLQALLAGTLSQKVLTLAQRHCWLCSKFDNGSDAGHALAQTIPMRIAAQSRQVLDAEEFLAFQKAVAAALAGTRLRVSLPLCITITYVLNSSRRDPDLDNMTKAALDAFSRALRFDDKHIHHLDVVKVRARSAEEFMIFHVQRSSLNASADVVANSFVHDWAGQPIRTIDQFLGTPRAAPDATKN